MSTPVQDKSLGLGTMTMERPKHLLGAVKETLHNYGVGLVVGLVLVFLVPHCLRCCLLHLGGVFFVATLVAPLAAALRPRKRAPPEGKAVFISGCDSGFGHMLAQKLDDLGFRVFAGCLQPEGDGANVLKKSGSNRMIVVPLDVTQDDSVQKAKELVAENLKDSQLWAVVNNAGMNEGAEILWTNVDSIKRVMEVNTFGVVRVTKAFLPLIVPSKGRVVAVASAAGRYTYPGMVPYCMSKQSVISFCDGLRLEMYRFGVKVVTIEPWMFKTAITNDDHIMGYITRAWEKAPQELKDLHPPDYLERYKKRTIKFITHSISHRPEDVVSCLEEAVVAVNPRYSYSPGTIYSRVVFWFMKRMPKSITDLIITDQFACKF